MGLRNLITLCGLAILAGGAYLQGELIGRWQQLPAAPAIDLSAIPQELGDWKSSEFTLAKEALAIGGIEDHLAREYVDQITGDVVTVALVAGAGGPISVHPPEVCFTGQGFQMPAPPKHLTLTDAQHGEENQFAWATFRRSDPASEGTLQLLWGWTSSGIWSAPSNPRLAFARSRRLYKLYVIQNVAASGPEKHEPALKLAELLLPRIRNLFLENGAHAETSNRTEKAARKSSTDARAMNHRTGSPRASASGKDIRIERVFCAGRKRFGATKPDCAIDTDWGVC